MNKTSNNTLLDRISNLYVSKRENFNKIKNFTEENKKKIEALKDCHKGERCFIIGGSPSLKQLDLAKLNNEYTFTLNHGYKLKEFGLEHSNYHVMCSAETFTEDNVLEYMPKDFCNKFLIYGGFEFPYQDKTIFYDYKFSSIQYFDKYFQTDLTKPLFAGPSTIIQMVQMATYMGFNEIYIIGVDLDFDKNKGHIYSQTSGEATRQKEDNTADGVDFTLKSLGLAAKFLKKFNVKLYNASPCGILDTIPRVKFEDLF